MKPLAAAVFAAGAISALAQSATPGATAHYVHENAAAGTLRPSVVREFTLAAGAQEGGGQWLRLDAHKANGESFRVWVLNAAAPSRYWLQEGGAPPREYRHAVTGEAVLPPMGGWEHLLPRPLGMPEQTRYLGHRYVRQATGSTEPFGAPPGAAVVALRPDLLIGPASNTRQKDETRRYDTSDYEPVRLTQPDYAEMARAGVTCVRVDAEQAPWAEGLGMFYWGPQAGAKLPYPELLYRSQYLGPALYLDEPAVGTRDHVLRPRLAKDPEFRRAMTPQIAFDAFREHFRESLDRASGALARMLAARGDVDTGAMQLAQEDLYTWETMPDTAAWQLSQDPRAPAAFVFEPPGRIGSRRTIPEMNMTYGTRLPADDPRALSSLIFSFLRGAARATGKQWGVSIYGAVDRADAPWWLTHAYDLGATRFFFWDNYQLACVPYGEMLGLVRHLRAHAAQRPARELARLRRAAERAILLPPGYGLGHVQTGKGSLWGIGELNPERRNRHGVTYRAVMSNFFAEVEHALQTGIAFDALWDLPDVPPAGYREVVRIREDGTVDPPRTSAERAGGPGPKLEVSVSKRPAAGGTEMTARAVVTETAAPVYYTYGADDTGVYQNAMVFWELYGPEEEDYVAILPEKLRPRVRAVPGGGEVETSVRITRAGSYRLRAATVDTAGRTTVVWREFRVP